MGQLDHPELGQGSFDDCVVTFYRAPRSYTGEDLVEISIHGGNYLQEKLLQVLSRQPGVRLADPGEFTLRAFLNGKLDLTRAEAVADLIHARDAAAHRSARHQLHGELFQTLLGYRDRLVHVLAQLEAELDFSDQEIDLTPPTEHLPVLDDLLVDIKRLLASFFYGRRIQEGFRVPLVGPPNVGKSTLFNSLAGHSRAIVNPVAGTTRDTIEWSMRLGEHTLVLIDTAGLHRAADQVERDGIQRAREELERADLILSLESPDIPAPDLPANLEVPILPVFTKSDLSLPSKPGRQICVSGLKGTGLDTLRDHMEKTIRKLRPETGGVILTNQRHADILERFQGQLQRTHRAFSSETPVEYLAADLRSALDILGEITGETTPDDILNHIFHQFCIGK